MKHILSFAAVVALTAAGIGCDDGIQRTSSSDIYTEPSIQPDFDTGIWTASLVFDRVAMGRTDRRPLRIGHSGQDALVVSEIYIEGLRDCDRVEAGLQPGENFAGELDARCQWSIDERPALPLTLENNAFVDIQLAYENTGTPPSPATLVIVSNALDKETVRIEMNVVAASPRIAVTPATLSFPGGVNGRDILTVRNTGSGTLTVSDYRLRLLNDPPLDPDTMEPLTEFIVDPDRDLPWVLDEGGAIQVVVEYEPQDEGADNAELILTSDDPQAPTTSVLFTSNPVTSNLVVQPNPVVFGTPMGANPIVRQVSFTNTGLRTLFINELSIEQDVEAFRFEGQNSFQVIPGQSRQLSITFQPQSAEGSDATLVVSTDADNLAGAGGRLLVPLLRSNAEVAALEISPLTVEMNRVAAGASEDATITLSNPGGLPLTVQRIALTTDDDAPLLASDPEFSITAGGGMTTIEPGAEHAVTVRFSRGADDGNLHIGTLIVESDSPTSPDVVRFTSRPVQD